ncbi:hypothetical protein [Metamycoplasma neophronis]|uniref:DUF4231 domain-containing protein n=1 Tax=Metamycoplasma neophronis TaxID=872983 RepID=A0ABY2Z1E7_9BACT|nr:hypothetical protein [Metamycoplasma neophronis]TPR53377.1 hypothetical protein FJR74_02595 [Metamycoplasma neophronis]
MDKQEKKNNHAINENLVAYFDSETRRLNKKNNVITFFQITLGILIIILNLLIIALAGYALYLGKLKFDEEVVKDPNSKLASSISISIIVAFFTILSFVLVITQSIYKLFAKTAAYKRIFKSMDYVENIYIYDEKFTAADYERNIAEIEKLKIINPKHKIKEALMKTLRGESDDK